MPRRDPAFLTDVLDALNGFVYVYDLSTGRNVYVSQRWGSEFGYSLDETEQAEGLLERIIYPEDLQLVEEHHRALGELATDEVRTLEYRVRRKDGSIAWVRSLDRPMARDASGRVTRIVGHAHDVTAEKAAQSARAEGEARFRAIVDNLPDAVFIADRETRILHVNDTACEQLGYTREELEGMRVFDFVAPEFQPRIPTRLAAPAGTATARLSAHVRKDGTRVPVETVVVAIEIGGNPAYMGVARDVSDRQRLEAQLRDAQRMEAIGRLAGAVAHDFNNVLAAILGGASLLEQQLADDPRGRRTAGEIRMAASRGAALTRQLLTFGRRQPTDMQALELAGVVEGTLTVLRRLLDPSIRLATELSPDCVVSADRGMMDQVVMNLALNARDAMPSGGTLTFRLRPHPDEDGRIELAVSDTGVGIAAEDLPNVFEPFYTTKGAQGSGIGLATVYGIVSQHGGRISVESAPGEGSTFRISLPRVLGPRGARDALRTAPTPDRKRLTVLLVDDMLPVRAMVARLLEVVGHRVIEADGPNDALSVWAERGAEIDFLLSDVALSDEMDGAALARRLRRDQADLPVLLMSGFAPPEQLELDEGIGFLQKPFTLEQLDAALRAGNRRRSA